MTFTSPGAKSRAPTLSYPQVKRWKSAKTHTPAPHLAAAVQPTRPIWSPQWWCDASEPLKRRRNNAFYRWRGAMRQIFTIHRNPPVRGVARPPLHHTQFFCGRASPTASAASREGPPWRSHTKAFPWGRVTRKPSMGQAQPWPSRRQRPAGDASTPWPPQRFRRNQIKASLSAFQRWKVKVLGFGVKTRLSPQRMASRGCSDPFALVGTIGKACGEAWVCVFFGSPPGVGVCFPFVVVVCGVGLVFWLCSCVGCVVCWLGWLVDVVRVLTGFAC